MSSVKRKAECHPEKAHMARGLCQSCYNKFKYIANRERILAANHRWKEANYERHLANVKKWKKENPDKVKASHQRTIANHNRRTAAWKKSNPEKVSAGGKAWYRKNKEKVRLKGRAWRLANKERARRTRKEWRAANAERHRATNRSWRLANLDKIRARKKNPLRSLINVQRRRARKKSAAGKATVEQWAARSAFHGNRCVYCGRSGKLTIDHAIPLSRGGANWPSNLVPACKSCNSRKHDKTYFEFVGGAA